ncbi:MAG TPA: PrsW family glutamic-type intramembrane protease [Chitinophagales bacterium]|nr:PrsW family glutamic-type intramembrane protease [Chitinophagales bacterium]
MNALILLALAVAPGLAICILIYVKDKYNREPRLLLILSFILGMIAIIPAYFIEQTGAIFVLEGTSTEMTLVFAFIVVGATEEGCKFFMLRVYSYRKRDFDEPFDGIMYSVMIAMGFATLENIMYVSQFGIGNAFLRMFTAVPAHAVCGIIMGYYAGLAKFNLNAKPLLFRGWFYAMLLHGAYDFSLMDKNIPLIIFGAVLSLYLGVRFSLKAIRLHQEGSPFRNRI